MALLRHDDPFNPLVGLQSELERFLRNPDFSLGPSGRGAFPPLNIFDNKDFLMIVAEAPGLDPATINLSGQGQTLSLSGERKPETESDAEASPASYHRRERSFGSFSRSVQLPQEFDVNAARAKYANGLLAVRVPRHAAAKPRQIKVEAS
jgi:HSP20 family protein